MRVLKLTFSGFKAFKEQSKLVFPKESGLFFMTGVNRHPGRQRLGRNALGKSTVWDALCWTLYGKTARGVRGGSVASWGSTAGPKGRVVVLVHGKKLVVTRITKPKTEVRVDGEAVEQSRVDALLGLDYSGFLATVLFGQFNLSFFDLSATQKLNLLTDSLDLGVWLEAADRARVLTKKLETEDREAADESVRLEERKRGLVELLEKLDAGQRESRKRTRERVAELEDKLKGESARADACSVEVAALRRNRLESIKQFEQALVEYEEAVEEERKQHGIVNQLSADLKQSQRDCSELKDKIAKFKDLREGDCPTCAQHVGSKHVDPILAKLRDERDWCIGERKKIEARKALEDQGLEARHRRTIKLQETRTRLGAVREGLESKEEAASKRYGMALKLVAELTAGINSLKQQGETTNRETYAEQLRLLDGKLDHHSKERAEALRRLQGVSYWVGGFKDLRLWLVEQALRELEVDINNALLDLGLEGWAVRLDVERETTTGEVSRGFSVLVKSPDADDYAPWEAWSGGETGRLRIAGAAGLASLIARRRGISASLEVWDEPTQHLSAEGIDDLLEFLWARAEAEGRQVWLVDHRTLDAGRFKGQVLVERDEQGSRIIPQAG